MKIHKFNQVQNLQKLYEPNKFRVTAETIDLTHSRNRRNVKSQVGYTQLNLFEPVLLSSSPTKFNEIDPVPYDGYRLLSNISSSP